MPLLRDFVNRCQNIKYSADRRKHRSLETYNKSFKTSKQIEQSKIVPDIGKTIELVFAIHQSVCDKPIDVNELVRRGVRVSVASGLVRLLSGLDYVKW
jgi:hypothetical protein